MIGKREKKKGTVRTRGEVVWTGKSRWRGRWEEETRRENIS